MPDYPIYTGPTEVDPSNGTQTLYTSGKICDGNILIRAPVLTATVNAAGGNTVTIGGED